MSLALSAGGPVELFYHRLFTQGDMKVPSSLVCSHGLVPNKKPRKNRSRKPQNKENILLAGTAKKNDIPPWRSFAITQQYASDNVILHDEIMAFQNWTMLTRQELDARRIMLDCINTITKHVFSDAKIELSGSSATSLAYPAVELDVVISTQEVHSDIGKKYALSQLATKLKQAKFAKTTVQIPYKNVPVLKLITSLEHGSFEVDISINNVDSLQAANAVNDYLFRMPALRPLVTVVKALLGNHELDNPSTGGLSSYAITCMCIFFIKANPTKRPSFYYDYPVISKSLGTLLSDFLQHFSIQFPYSTSRISAKNGRLYPNTDTYRDRDGHSAMNVECLTNPEINVAETVTALTLQQIINVFLVGLGDIVKPSRQDHNVLTRLVGCDKSVRRRVRRLTESGKLEMLLFELRHHLSSITAPIDQSIFENGRGTEARTIEPFFGAHQYMQFHEQVTISPVPSVFRIGGTMAMGPTHTTRQYNQPPYPYFPSGTGGMRLL